MSINSSVFINVVGATQATIGVGQGVSTPVITNGTTPLALSIPALWTTCNVTFAALPAGGSTYSNDIVTTSGVYTFTNVVANDYLCLDPTVFASINNFQIKTSITQVATANISVQFAPILNVANLG